LVDTGYPDRDGRDPDRIQAAMRDAHLQRIDDLLITHMHEDHNGGAAELARRVPIGAFIDYGVPVETSEDVVAAFAAYRGARDENGKNGPPHIIPAPGDSIHLSGVDVRVLSIDGQTVTMPLQGAGQPNAACAAYEPRQFASRENPRSIGIHLRYGKFTFLDLGDLVGPNLLRLVCPNNLIGAIDAYLVTHHGNGDTNVEAVLAALRARVAIVDNGPYKGGSPSTWASLRQHPEIEGVWQLHKSLIDGSENFPDTFIANLDDGPRDGGAWIKLSATDDGGFSVTNGRTGWTRHYDAR
ncbi:MAG TPA: MBL fold metallo-hydrolase, partial [Vicinamibacterales bacterium]|nr:MBL fold metallo-hydrolase [Vicinamibacterales bacterium]